MTDCAFRTPTRTMFAASRTIISQMRFFFFFSSRRRHTRSLCDWSSDVCSSDLPFTLLDTLLHERLVLFYTCPRIRKAVLLAGISCLQPLHPLREERRIKVHQVNRFRLDRLQPR